MTGSGGARSVKGNTVYQQTSFSRSDGGQTLAWDVAFAQAGEGVRVTRFANALAMSLKTADGAVRDVVAFEGDTALNIDLNAAAYASVQGMVGTVRGDTVRHSGERDVVILGGDGDDRLSGGGGDDIIAGNDGADRLSGGAGDDVLLFDGDDVLVDGGAGRDTAIWVGSGAVRLALTLNASTVTANDYQRLIGVEQVYGGPGDDVILDYTDAGVTIHGLDGDDRLFGGSGNDLIHGGGGVDTIFGMDGDDRLHGGDGADRLRGGRGDDHLYGGSGRDVMIGDAGLDVFGIEGTASAISGADYVWDFRDGDRLDPGDGVTRIWYRQTHANSDANIDTVLYDNADGSGGIYAILNGHDDPLTAEDFVRAGVTVTEIV